MLRIVLAASVVSAQTSTPVSRLDLPLEQRLNVPQRVALVPRRLTDFVSFIATSYKVPLLVERPLRIVNPEMAILAPVVLMAITLPAPPPSIIVVAPPEPTILKLKPMVRFSV